MLKKSTLLYLLALCLFSVTANAQNQENVWIFGKNIGLDFNTPTPPTLINSPAAYNGYEASASVCDPTTGDLLFYSSGDTVYNRNGLVMPNGMDLSGNFTFPFGLNPIASTSQGALIVPMPGQPGKYYLFSLTEFSYFVYTVLFPGQYPDKSGFLYYSVVDMSLDGGLGDVVASQKAIPLDTVTNFSEHMIGIAGNSCNAWVVLMDPQKAGTGINRFKSFEITPNGVDTAAVISNVFTTNQSIVPINQSVQQTVGRMAASPNRLKLATAIASGDTRQRLALFDFDPNTGLISNPLQLDTNYVTKPNTMYYGVSFSPDNSKLYATDWDDEIVYQFDITSNDADTIISTRTNVASCYSFSDMKRGPDGKIYYVSRRTGSKHWLGAITEPDMAGTACNPEDSAIAVNIGTTWYDPAHGFPNAVPVIITPDTLFAAVDTLFCPGQVNILQTSAASATSITWDNGDTTSTRTITESGTYWVVYKEDLCQVHADTFHVELIDLSPVITVNVFDLGTTVPYSTYQWMVNDTIIPGATGSTYTVLENGPYRVIVTDENGCTDTSDVYLVTNVGIHETHPLANQVKIYPNPSNDMIMVSAPAKVDLKLTSITGQTIKRATGASKISVKELATGMYLLHVYDQDGAIIKVEKVIKSE